MAAPSTCSLRTVKSLQSSVACTLDIGHNDVDQSISASKKNVARPNYDAMVASLERGEIDAIICWDLAGQSDRSDRITPAPQRNQGCTLKTFGGGGNSPSLPRDKMALPVLECVDPG